ncbi:MAG: permease-like cell division protein FtsX [Bacillota bacterium]
MRVRTWTYLVGQSLQGIRRHLHMSLASVTTMAVSLFVLGVFVVASLNLSYVAEVIESQIEIRAYLYDDIPAQGILDLEVAISALEYVTDVEYVDKDTALSRLKEQLGPQADLLEAVEEMNPLRNSFVVKVEAPEFVGLVASQVEEFQGVAKVDHRQDLMSRLSAVIRAIRVSALFIILLLGVATILIISNTVRLAVLSRQREVYIMKLVGATDSFIRWPFFLEGMLLGLAGAAVASFVLDRAYDWFLANVYVMLPFVPVLAKQPMLQVVSLGLITLGTAIGALGSSIPLKRFLRV